MRDRQRHFQHRQGGGVQRVGVDDAVHVRAGAVHPAVETVGRVGHALALEHLEVLVDPQQVAGGNLVEAQPQLLGVVGAGLLGTAGDLPGQAGIMAALEEDSAGQGQFCRAVHVLSSRLVCICRSACWISWSLGRCMVVAM